MSCNIKQSHKAKRPISFNFFVAVYAGVPNSLEKNKLPRQGLLTFSDRKMALPPPPTPEKDIDGQAHHENNAKPQNKNILVCLGTYEHILYGWQLSLFDHSDNRVHQRNIIDCNYRSFSRDRLYLPCLPIQDISRPSDVPGDTCLQPAWTKSSSKNL